MGVLLILRVTCHVPILRSEKSVLEFYVPSTPTANHHVIAAAAKGLKQYCNKSLIVVTRVELYIFSSSQFESRITECHTIQEKKPFWPLLNI